MKFRVEHTFSGISLSDYEKLHFDEAFNEALCKATKLGREVKKREISETSLERIVNVIPEQNVPPAIAKVFGGTRIEYEEHISYTFGSGEAPWHITPKIMGDKIKSHGRVLISESPEGVVRTVEGEVKVKLFGIGIVIEKFIGALLETGYKDAAKFTQKWIDDKKV